MQHDYICPLNQQAHTRKQYIECLKYCYPVIYDVDYEIGGYDIEDYDDVDQAVVLVEDKSEPYGVALYSYLASGLGYYSFTTRTIQTCQQCPSITGPYRKHDIEEDCDLMKNMRTEIAQVILATIKENKEIQKYIDEQEKIDSFEPIGYTEEDRINSGMKNKEYYFS